MGLDLLQIVNCKLQIVRHRQILAMYSYDFLSKSVLGARKWTQISIKDSSASSIKLLPVRVHCETASGLPDAGKFFMEGVLAPIPYSISPIFFIITETFALGKELTNGESIARRPGDVR
jgi:hypothetical protein